MDTAHSFPSPPPEPIDPTADSAESGGSFWTGAPKLLAAFATLLGSIVALTTVLVQAGVIGSRLRGSRRRPTVPVQPAPVQTAPIRRRAADTRRPPRPDAVARRTLGDLNGLLAESARTKGDLGTLIADVQAGPPAIDRAAAVARDRRDRAVSASSCTRSSPTSQRRPRSRRPSRSSAIRSPPRSPTTGSCASGSSRATTATSRPTRSGRPRSRPHARRARRSAPSAPSTRTGSGRAGSRTPSPSTRPPRQRIGQAISIRKTSPSVWLISSGGPSSSRPCAFAHDATAS